MSKPKTHIYLVAINVLVVVKKAGRSPPEKIEATK